MANTVSNARQPVRQTYALVAPSDFSAIHWTRNVVLDCANSTSDRSAEKEGGLPLLAGRIACN